MVGTIHKLNTDLVCLLETRVKENKIKEIVNKQFQGWRLFHNYSKAYNGRIWLLWKGSVDVNLLDVTDQSITCKIHMDSHNFFFSAIYGSNDGIERRKLWDHLIFLHSSIYAEPWILTGDLTSLHKQMKVILWFQWLV